LASIVDVADCAGWQANKLKIKKVKMIAFSHFNIVNYQ